MAMVKLSGMITEIEGKVGGVVWRKDQCGQHVQKAPRPGRRPPTTEQWKRRRCFSNCLHHYFHKLNEWEQRLWWIWSYEHPKKNKKGVTVYMQAHMAFLSVNLNRCYKDQPLLDIPPGLEI